MIVISDTSPITNLAAIGRFENIAFEEESSFPNPVTPKFSDADRMEIETLTLSNPHYVFG